VKIHVVPDLSGSAWTGPRQRGAGTFGELWAGQGGLLSTVETALGLAGPEVSQQERAASVVSAVRETLGFWSESAERDALAVAGTLLEWRDRLALDGWDGSVTEGRLGELWAVTRDALPGLPDRLWAALAGLAEHEVGLERVTVVERREELGLPWRRLLDALEAQGVVVEEAILEGATASGDLQGARDKGLEPSGDASLQLVRPAHPARAAEELAAALASQKDLSNTVLIGSDAILDAALRRHGLPTLGSTHPEPQQLANLLPLVVRLGWKNADPQHGLALFEQRGGPVPRKVARALLRAMGEWPAIRGRGWNEALTDGLAEIEDEAYRKRVEERLDVLLSEAEETSGYPKQALEERARVMDRWLISQHASSTPPPGLGAARAQIDTLQKLLAAEPGDHLSRVAVDRLLDRATAAAGEEQAWPSQAGLVSVGGPEAVLAPARRVIWWGFTRDSAPIPARLPLTPSERRALESAGVVPSPPGDQARRSARRWARPLHMTSEQLVLICPQTNAKGEDEHPHPLWDEILSRCTGEPEKLTRVSPLLDDEPTLQATEPLETPLPRRDWTIQPGRVEPRKTESPTSLEKLLGCPFRWVVDYMGNVRSGSAASLASGPLLKGRLLHELIEEVLGGETLPTAEEAEQLVGEAFDREAAQLAGEYFQPGAEGEKAKLRALAAEATRRLVEILHADGLTVLRVEKPKHADPVSALGTKLSGRPDLVLGPTPKIVDVKFGSKKRREDALKAGTALQLAVYAHLEQAGSGASYPPAAYYILVNKALISDDGDAFPSAWRWGSAGTYDTWQALERAVAREWTALEAGQLSAPGNPNRAGDIEPEKPGRDAADALLIPAECRYCDYGTLCGRDPEVNS